MDVDSFSEAERAAWDAFPQARTVDLRCGDPARDDPARGGEWNPGRTLRAEVVAALLLGGRAAEPGRTPAVRLYGARITGQLDLAFAGAIHAALLQNCYFDTEPQLDGARSRLVNLSGSCLPGLRASDAHINGLLTLDRCRFGGPVRLTGAYVTGTLSLRGTELRGDPALFADSLTIGRDMICAQMVIYGECLMWSARVSGTLVLDGARFERPGGNALSADGLIAERGVFCREGFTAVGEVRFCDARIGRQLTMAGASLRNAGATALVAERLNVDGALNLDDGFTAEGEVMLRGATVRGGLSLGRATLRNRSGIALNARRATVEGGLSAVGGFAAEGEVQLADMRVQGSIEFQEAHLSRSSGIALLADRLDITGRFFFGPGFAAEGEVRLVDAHIGAGLYLSGSHVSNNAGRAVTAWGLSVGGVADCCDGFTADGLISFANARIGAELCLEAATIRADVHLDHMRATSLKTGPDTVIDGTMDLRYAAVEILRDDPGGWPAAVQLNGFSYITLASPLRAAERLRWLARDPAAYHPQPYEQLAAVYRAMGNETAARAVLLARQRVRRRTLSLPRRAWGHLQDLTVGYGYAPLRAAVWLIALLITGTVTFAAHNPPPLVPGQAPEFNPLLYSLDLLLPIAGFGQRNAFNPHGWEHWLAAALIAAGWILATTIAAGVTRILSRQ